jgi:hypothetical protein
MSLTGFFVANITGTLVRLYLIRRLGEAFEAPIDDVLGFISEYRIPLLIVSVVVFTVMMVNELRETKGEVAAIADTIDDGSAEASEPEPPVS